MFRPSLLMSGAVLLSLLGGCAVVPPSYSTAYAPAQQPSYQQPVYQQPGYAPYAQPGYAGGYAAVPPEYVQQPAYGHQPAYTA